jgi:hypothetical protein
VIREWWRLGWVGTSITQDRAQFGSGDCPTEVYVWPRPLNLKRSDWWTLAIDLSRLTIVCLDRVSLVMGGDPDRGTPRVQER